jgi:16S rRNA (cytosine967-C5)-methyltransferase
MPDSARQIALEILTAVETSPLRLDALFKSRDDRINGLIPAEKALVRSLVYGTLRWRGHLDWIVTHVSTTPLRKINPRVLNCLRLALFQIIYLDKIPVSAAVNTAVELVKDNAPAYVVKFANAVLRRAARDHRTIPWPPLETDPPLHISVTKSIPRWLAARWMSRYGINDTLALCDAINRIPPITVRTNFLKTTRKELMEALGGITAEVWPCDHVPEALSFYRPDQPIPGMAPFAQGLFQVQDEAAQVAAHLLNPLPGQSVLDACAGLGGKTGHIAQLMRGQGVISAVDRHDRKILSLQKEMKRLGIGIVRTHSLDLLRPLPRAWRAQYDRILLDAPCSGLGVIRRHPDIRWREEKKNLVPYQRKQIALLERLTALLKPSGLLVYAVCSVETEENEAVVKAFLSKQVNMAQVPEPNWLPAGLSKLPDSRGAIRTLPHCHDMDGFFMVCFEKQAN